jgi:hypothetical protein
MRPFKIFGGLVLGASAMLLVSSCTKNVDEQMEKGDREVGKFTAAPCGPIIGLIGASTSGYFYVGDPNNVPARQNFSGTNFTDDRYFKITGVGGTAIYANAPIRQIGVGNQWINAGQALWLELGSSFSTQKMQGFDLVIHGEGTAPGGTTPSTGMIELYNGMTLVHTIPLSQTKDVAVSYLTTHTDPKFDRIKISTTAGKLALSGRSPNVNFLGLTKFYLVPDESTYVFMVINNTQTMIGATNYDDWYINYKELGVRRPSTQRQNRVMGTSLAAGSGAFPAMNPGKEWLKFDAGQGNTMVARYDNQRIGINNQFIDAGETLTITPGADFPTSSFRSFEVREAGNVNHPGANKMEVKLWKGAMQVGGGMTTGTDATFNTFVGTEDFDKVTITRYSGTPSIGRLSPSPGYAMRVYPGCN